MTIRKSGVPAQHTAGQRVAHEAEATAGGALTGAVVGIIGGPPGMVAGAVLGGIIAAIAEGVLESDVVSKEAHNRDLDEEPPVTERDGRGRPVAETDTAAPWSEI